MNDHKMDHNLIEHMLMMLNVAQQNNINIDFLSENLEQIESSIPLDHATLNSVCAIIRFMDEMPGGFLIYHAGGDEEIIYANKAVLRIFRCRSLEEFRHHTGNSFRGMVCREDVEMVEQSISEQIAQSHHDLDYVEYRIIRKDGVVRWVEDYGHFIQSEAVGDIFYVFLTDSTDKKNHVLSEKAALISEKEEKEQKLQTLIEEYDQERKINNQEQLRRLDVIEGLSVNYASILYVDLDQDKVLPYRLSTRTEQQFGSEFKPHKFSKYACDYVNTWVHPEDRAMVAKVTTPDYIREKLTSSKTYYVNYRILSGPNPQYLQLRIVNVSTDKRISQVVLGYRSVDEEILLEREHQRALEEALNNAKLANNAKSTFLSNMSHDMRTPLNAIFGYTTLARQHVETPETALGYLDKIEVASRQLLDLIEKVLEISWMESKDIQITESECNLCDILQDIQKNLMTQVSVKKISLDINSASLEHCDIYGDHAKIKQFLMYLASNAVKYTRNGGRISITVSELEQLPNDCSVYQFVVEDTGIGIHREFLEHIFEPFEREQNTTFSGIHGTGLGLTIAKNIVELMGGTITARSTVGVGSTFTVTMRLRTQTNPLLTSIDTDQVLDQLMNKKILLVDDNEINLEIETEILSGLGFSIDTALNGIIAVNKIRDSKPGDYAVVLMDIQMPVMDGRQAAKAIRELDDPVLSRIPIIALSANAFEIDRRMSLKFGMNEHLTKPIDIPLLLETIARTVSLNV
ncbi:MAG: response regulator [Lachnospiraceae bacterium]|mgnify:CR=1 FL=1|nr:response regulator [Lachnospiraceae bacterium]